RATGDVDALTLESFRKSLKDQHAIVHGTVRAAGGSPLGHVEVSAIEKRLLSEHPLGEASPTAVDGTYVIAYEVNSARNGQPHGGAAGRKLSLVVRAYGPDKKVIAESIPLSVLPVTSVVDLMVDGGTCRGPSELEAVAGQIAPLLDGARLSELGDDET